MIMKPMAKYVIGMKQRTPPMTPPMMLPTLLGDSTRWDSKTVKLHTPN